ncbi:hypothetical protein [Actinacidiphila epipremni]|uniref:Lipoprotein n=1 Tax=Actinacidiphila epipremni TaxID=2053013 RepID=A0ABX0ZI42_9ACTN|nr:hypothetical protein [Actinacidiphila epipremni]NJP42472.1 hypothetical protein [Actinacidiphila epipremni]
MKLRNTLAVIPALVLLAACGSHDDSAAEPAASPATARTTKPAAHAPDPVATEDPAAERAASKTASMETEMRAALTAANLPPGRDAGQITRCGVDFALVYADKVSPHAREKLTATLHSYGWKDALDNGSDETRLLRDDWEVYLTRTDLGKVKGVPSHMIEVDAHCSLS